MKNGDSLNRGKLRSFGLLVGLIFSLLGIVPVITKGRSVRLWALALSAALIISSLLSPRLLVRPYGAWMALGRVLNWINTRIILGIIFYAIITPMAVVMRMFGYDPLSLLFDDSILTYKVRVKSKNPKHMERQF